MGPVKDILGLPQEFKKAEKEEEPRRVRRPKEARTEKIAGKPGTKVRDKVEISASGKNLLHQKKEISQYLDQLKHLQTVSHEEIRTLQQKIGAGFYSKPEVSEKIVESLLTLPVLERTLPQNTQDMSSLDQSKLDEDRLAGIRERIRKGEYDSDLVLGTIIERLLQSGQL